MAMRMEESAVVLFLLVKFFSSWFVILLLVGCRGNGFVAMVYVVVLQSIVQLQVALFGCYSWGLFFPFLLRFDYIKPTV